MSDSSTGQQPVPVHPGSDTLKDDIRRAIMRRQARYVNEITGLLTNLRRLLREVARDDMEALIDTDNTGKLSRLEVPYGTVKVNPGAILFYPEKWESENGQQ